MPTLYSIYHTTNANCNPNPKIGLNPKFLVPKLTSWQHMLDTVP